MGKPTDGRYRTLFLAAKKGDDFTVKATDYPDGDKVKLLMRVQTMRSYYKKHFGILTAMSREDDGAAIRLTILSPAGENPEAVVTESAPGVDANKKAKAEAPKAAPKSEAPPPDAEPAYSEDARAFFREVFLSQMRMLPGATPEQCASAATGAARAYTERFG